MIYKEVVGDSLVTIYGDNKSDIDRKKKELGIIRSDTKKNSDLNELPTREKK